MNIEAYNLDSLRKLVRDLQKENKELRLLLDKAEVPYTNSEVFSEIPSESKEYDLDQGARMSGQYVNEYMVRKFFSMFWGRMDVFAKRAKNGNYYPQCDNRWNNAKCPKQRNEKIYCEDCEHQCWTKLTLETIEKHLWGYRDDGADVIGIYPLLPDRTCRLLVFDFDNHEKDAEKNDFANENEDWHDEVDALRLICKQNGIDALVERSRSGRGAHIWIFFKNPIPASVARNFGFLLLDKGATTINLKTFRYYDRMYPSQEVANTIGNLIALPLQGQALKSGNSAFVDEHWNAYPNQWDKLFQTKKLEREEVEAYIAKWQADLSNRVNRSEYTKEKNRLKPWKRKDGFVASDVTGKLHIVLADGVYIDALNLTPRLQNQIRCMATFDNPVFYKNKRLGYSNYYNFSMVYMGEDIEGYIKIPRGMLEDIVSECKSAGIQYDIEEQREKGRPIRVSFNGELRVQQDLAAQRLLAYEHGILSAATAFGKTVVCSYLIAERKVNTLILLESTELIRCMHFIKDVLEEVRNNGDMISGKSGKEPALPFPLEVLDGFSYVEDKSITHVLNQIYEPIAELNVKKVSVTKVTSALKEEGYLLDEPNTETGKTRKVPSVKGKELGIYIVEREYHGRMFQSVTYNQNAQEYVVRLIRKLLGEQ